MDRDTLSALVTYDLCISTCLPDWPVVTSGLTCDLQTNLCPFGRQDWTWVEVDT